MSEANGEDVVLDDWAKSKTKAILESMIIKGEIPVDDWPPARVYELKDEFKNMHYKRQFVSGLRRLRNEITERKVRVNFDRQAIDHDRRLYPAATITQQGFLRWPGSEAQRLMKQDVDTEVYLNMTPKELYDSRPEYYRNFELTQIREHLYQEARSRKTSSYWKWRKEQQRLAGEEAAAKKKEAAAKKKEAAAKKKEAEAKKKEAAAKKREAAAKKKEEVAKKKEAATKKREAAAKNKKEAAAKKKEEAAKKREAAAKKKEAAAKKKEAAAK
jgi:pyruvate/2-oxoglutarate dehydrogenase complex dihydrolipoamide acyltransferase (E2) component